MLRRITRDQVKLGMYVHAFDGSWLSHPFWFSRFHVTEPKQLLQIRNSAVDGIIIDDDRGLPPEAPTTSGTSTVARAPDGPPHTTRASSLAAQRSHSFSDEREHAAALVKSSAKEVKRLFAAAHDGEQVELAAFTPLVADVVASISRNPYALIAITRIKKQDEYTYVHSLAVSALMASLAKNLGMSDAEVLEYGLAGLVHDIGKMAVPDGILKKPDALTEEEFAIVRTHPEQGYRLLSRNADISAVILDVCRHHHERLDGSGYPFRLKGDQISRAARIAAICDVYDALTSNRSYKKAWSASATINRMHDWSGHFDRELLFAFMKTVGVYPAGLLVYLRSNRLGVVMPNGRRSSRPKVRAFYCARNRVPLPLEDVIPEEDLMHDQVIREEYALDWGFTDWPLVAEQLINGVTPQLGVTSQFADTTR